jgi:hypothetical protein
MTSPRELQNENLTFKLSEEEAHGQNLQKLPKLRHAVEKG